MSNFEIKKLDNFTFFLAPSASHLVALYSMQRFTIGDITNLTGLSAHSIRKWEERYQLLPTKRTESNIRCYDQNDLSYFLNVSALLKSGYKISAIAKMDTDAIRAAINKLAGINQEAGMPENKLINATLNLDNYGLGNVLDYLIERHGMVRTATEVIFPFMIKVGWMWQVGTLNPAHEHFASNIIRQKMITAINGLPDKVDDNAKRFLLFLPPRETHDLGLLMAYYMLKERRQHVLYLGQDMPYEYLNETAAYYNPDYAISALTQSLDEPPGRVVDSIMQHLPYWPVLLSGALIENPTIKPHPRLTIIKTLPEFEKLLDKLVAG